METDINDHILLVGEANFSFTISLANYCKNRDFITTTCYESLDDLKKIFGENVIENNLALLNSLNVNKIYFSIDACNLHDYHQFRSIKYSKIIFMFPHACCKKTNLKLNRNLLELFLLTSKLLLKFNGCVYVTLARGQGGTKFDVNLNPLSEKANDNWQLIQIANKCGYLLSDVYRFDANLFSYYKSTGYKVQNKSFNIENALVHRLELSLPIERVLCLSSELQSLNKLLNRNFNNCSDFDCFKLSSSNYIDQYLKTSAFIYLNKVPHVLNLLKARIVGYLNEDLVDLKINLYKNYIDTHLTSTCKTDYMIDSIECLKQLDLIDEENNVDSNLNYFVRNRLRSDDLLGKLNNNFLNICDALVLDDQMDANNELNNYKYEILFYLKTNSFDKSVDHLKSMLIDILINRLLLSSNKDIQINIEDNEDNSTYFVNQKILFNITMIKSTEFICELDASYLCLLINKLDDKRLLYSNDNRNFQNSDSYLFKPFLIQNVSYTHDLCFWYNRNEFDEKKFLNLIRDLTYNQLRYVILIDKNFKKVNLKYKNDFDDDENIYSAFYRFIYETYDKAVDFDTIRYIQDTIRDDIKLKLNLVPR